MLHITNGESAAYGIQHTGVAGEVFSWDDALHEGPVPADLSLEQMSKVHARFIAEEYGLPYAEVIRDFTRRDAALTRFREHKEVVLWFEHDVYDQLQLLQLLDWFAQQDLKTTKLSLICINTFAGVEHFTGLGQLSPAQLASLFDMRQEVSQAMLQLGREAWQAFCSPLPLAIDTLTGTDTTALPFLRAAFVRHLEEFPGVDKGLSRTERQILEVVASGVRKPAELFRAQSRKEENAFMGDMTFWIHVSHLCNGSRPLLKRTDDALFSLPVRGRYQETFHEQAIVLTEDGQAVLDGQAVWIGLCGGIDRWLGGVHLQGKEAAWRWHERSHMLQQNT